MNETELPTTEHHPRRSRAGKVGATTFGVAAVTAAALLLPVTVAGAEPVDSTDRSRTAEQPEYPIPDMPPVDDNQEYVWHYDKNAGKDSKTAGKYGSAFYDWFDGTDVDLPKQPPAQVFDNQIWLNTDDGEGGIHGEPTGESLPVYGLAAADYGDNWNGPPEFQAPGRDIVDSVTLQVWPKASFKDGSGESFEYLANCEDTEDKADGMTMLNDRTCTEGESPEGAKVLAVETVRSEKDSGDVYSKNNTVIVYRADGTAVKVSNLIPGHDHTDYPLDPKVDPYLDTDQLTELAQSMPDAVVEG